ncbi:menaquinone-dependent protoporphyrinogen IX dehydrogenase [Gammaproteobacteria bacterium]|nr:menaquinone-dependent protoporphyrinogen IX dehydrogenase [Gammaproteobacteria bacterium]
MHNLIIYSTTDGQTVSIAERIGRVLENSKVISIADAKTLNLNDFETIVVGASIRYGKHKPEVYKFIKDNLEVLDVKKNAFFSVNVVARKPEKNTPDTNPYMQKFLELSKWSPKNLSVFAGKIDYPQYKFVDKQMIRFIMWMTKGPTDINGTFEFTDWKKVESFAKELKSQ